MTDSEVNKKRSLNFAFLPIEGIQGDCLPHMAEKAQSGAWAVATFRTAAGDNALRQTEAIPAHLSMVIGERLHEQRGQRMGSYAGSVAIMRPEWDTQCRPEIRGKLSHRPSLLKLHLHPSKCRHELRTIRVDRKSHAQSRNMTHISAGKHGSLRVVFRSHYETGTPPLPFPQ